MMKTRQPSKYRFNLLWRSDALEVSLDYLTGKTALEIDQLMLKRMEQVAQMSDKDKDYVYTLLDAFIARTRIQGLV